MLDLTQHLIELELELQATSTRHDANEAGRLLSADFREFGASGRVWTRASMLAEMSSEAPYPIENEDFTCQQLTPELALLTYVATTPTRRTLRSSLWRRESGGWRVLFHQGTVIPPQP